MRTRFQDNQSMLTNSSILITGGTGSFGHAFVPLVLEKYNPRRLVIYSRDEMKQWEMAKLYGSDNRVRFFIGDVRDKDRLARALTDIDYVVHAAATKIVPIAEYNPFECVKTNVIGAMNLIDACIDQGVKRVVALSTDKASSPSNLYGATKLTSDKLFIAGNSYVGSGDTKFSVVRYGNVMGSRGSVIPFFLTLKDQGKLPITDERMTRFLISLEQAVDLVWHAFDDMLGGEVYVKKIPSIKLRRRRPKVRRTSTSSREASDPRGSITKSLGYAEQAVQERRSSVLTPVSFGRRADDR